MGRWMGGWLGGWMDAHMVLVSVKATPQAEVLSHFLTNMTPDNCFTVPHSTNQRKIKEE